jgi:hypothetical protein
MRKLVLLAGVLALLVTARARPFMVVAYNVENLNDVDGVAGFEDYQPSKYTRAHALTKATNVARAVAMFEGGRGPDILMFSELEVDFTPPKVPLDLEAVMARYAKTTLADMLGAKFDKEIGDLPAEALLLKAFLDKGLTGYHVVVPDVVHALGNTRKLEQKNVVFTRFPVKATKAHLTPNARPILEVQVEIDGAPLYLFVNHWKSGASDDATEKARVANAETLRARLNEIFKADPHADVILGGDFNSQYNQSQRYSQMARTGMNDVLGSQGDELAVRGPKHDLYNLWYELPVAERGSDTYRGEWGTLMHLILARGLYDYRGVQYVDNSFGVAKFPGLNADAKGIPNRWSFEGNGSGFSDHFPVFAKFVTVNEGRTDRYLALKNPGVEQKGRTEPLKLDFGKVDLEKVAVKASALPKGTNIRTPPYYGKIFRVEGTMAPSRLAVEFMGETYDIWSFDEAFRKKLQAQHKPGTPIKFYGELSQYKERWQFIVQDPSWVR